MHTPVTSSIICTIGLAITLLSGYAAFAQRISNPDSLSKNSFGWNQEEKEFGFFPARSSGPMLLGNDTNQRITTNAFGSTFAKQHSI